MRTRLIGLPLAGLLLVGAATVVLAQSGGSPATTGGGDPGAAASGSPAPQKGPVWKGNPVLDDVLKDLVQKGTITQAQSDAIVKAMEDRKAELRQQFQARREEMKALRDKIRGFLEDGVITQDELKQLPADNPLRKLDQFLDDGKITIDELRSLRGLGRGFGPGPGFGWGHGFGRGPKGGDEAPSSSAAPGSGSSS
jgi:hypothetical protein